MYGRLICVSMVVLVSLVFINCGVEDYVTLAADKCYKDLKSFIEVDLIGTGIRDSCLRDIQTGFCSAAECMEWLSKALPYECLGQGYDFLKEEGSCGKCRQEIADLKDPTRILMDGLCLDVHALLISPGA